VVALCLILWHSAQLQGCGGRGGFGLPIRRALVDDRVHLPGYSTSPRACSLSSRLPRSGALRIGRDRASGSVGAPAVTPGLRGAENRLDEETAEAKRVAGREPPHPHAHAPLTPPCLFPTRPHHTA